MSEVRLQIDPDKSLHQKMAAIEAKLDRLLAQVEAGLGLHVTTL